MTDDVIRLTEMLKVYVVRKPFKNGPLPTPNRKKPWR